jgi:hypothetical chaperone protein
MAAAGIDFGTTNSTGGVAQGGAVLMAELGDGVPAAPTVLFFDADAKTFSVGSQADAALRAGHSGRYMRSLKTYLGRKDRVTTRLGGRELQLEDLIAVILSSFRAKLETTAGEPVDHVVLGRPVRFNDDDDALDRQAQNRLEQAAKAAGFTEVSFQYEPVAAALAYEETVRREELIVVADIGGGTSDFSILRVGPGKQGQDRRDDILSNHGAYIGGDNFDASVIDGFVAPQMGKGTLFRSMTKRLPFPVHYFTWLARWHLFNNLLERKNLNELRSLLRVSEEPEKVGRLIELAENQLFFEFSGLVESAKKTLSTVETAELDMDIFTVPFQLAVPRVEFEDNAAPLVAGVMHALHESLRQAGVAADAVDRVFLTGGTTLVRSVKQGFIDVFGPARIVHTDVFTSVGYGLVREAMNYTNLPKS